MTFFTLEFKGERVKNSRISRLIVNKSGPLFQRFHKQGRIQKIQKEGAEETDDAILHHSGQTLGLTLRTFQKYWKKRGGGGGGPLAPRRGLRAFRTDNLPKRSVGCP